MMTLLIMMTLMAMKMVTVILIMMMTLMVMSKTSYLAMSDCSTTIGHRLRSLCLDLTEHPCLSSPSRPDLTDCRRLSFPPPDLTGYRYTFLPEPID